jgi:Domain of unknown function (DUF4432)
VIAADRIGHIDQVALATEKPALDVRVYRGIELRIHPTRGFDIGAAWFRGFPLAWISAVGEGGAESADWREAWGGGLLTTCGLDNVGAASEGIGLHGTYTFLAARDVDIVRTRDEIVCSATVDEPRGLRVERSIMTRMAEGRVEVHDRTTNISDQSVEALLLYHVNLGWPLWDEGARLASDATNVESDLPRLWQWIDPAPGTYALGIEPANCSVLGRAHDRAEGTLPELEPGEERTTSIVIRAEVI